MGCSCSELKLLLKQWPLSSYTQGFLDLHLNKNKPWLKIMRVIIILSSKDPEYYLTFFSGSFLNGMDCRRHENKNYKGF